MELGSPYSTTYWDLEQRCAGIPRIEQSQGRIVAAVSTDREGCLPANGEKMRCMRTRRNGRNASIKPAGPISETHNIDTRTAY
jgi:hypothetical protein